MSAIAFKLLASFWVGMITTTFVGSATVSNGRVQWWCKVSMFVNGAGFSLSLLFLIWTFTP